MFSYEKPVPCKRDKAERKYGREYPAKKGVEMTKLETNFVLMFHVSIANINTTGWLKDGASEQVCYYDVGEEDVVAWNIVSRDGFESDKDEVIHERANTSEG